MDLRQVIQFRWVESHKMIHLSKRSILEVDQTIECIQEIAMWADASKQTLDKYITTKLCGCSWGQGQFHP